MSVAIWFKTLSQLTITKTVLGRHSKDTGFHPPWSSQLMVIAPYRKIRAVSQVIVRVIRAKA